MKFSFKSLLILFLYFNSYALFANETGYEVELIIFEDVNARYLQSEDWSYNDMLRNKIADGEIDTTISKDEDLKAETTPDPEYIQLDWDGAKLSSQLERLLNNNNYRVLTSKRWKQTGLDREHAFNISINNKETAQEKPKKAHPDESINTNQEIDSATPVTAEAYLTGDVKLIMSRYLHFNINLQYVKPFENENAEITEKIFPVIDERRMRSREIHFIDHPLVGIIVLATPYTIEEKTVDKPLLPTEYKTM